MKIAASTESQITNTVTCDDSIIRSMQSSANSLSFRSTFQSPLENE